jgi:hypothetical protein
MQPVAGARRGLHQRVAAVAIATALLSAVTTTASAGVALAADTTNPTFTLTPAMGPPGTHVTITGHLSAAQIPVWAPMLTAPDVFLLLTDTFANCKATQAVCAVAPAPLDGCELLVDVTQEVVHADGATGLVTGSFVVGTHGTCFQSTPDATPHSALSGRYALSTGCQACEVGAFTLTAPSTLPFTGFPVLPTTLCGFVLIGTGMLLLRRRPHVSANAHVAG